MLNASTSVLTDFLIFPDVQNRLRGKYVFEVEWDLGWFAFTGGTGDFLAEYGGGCGDDNYANRPLPNLQSFSVSSPFPIDALCATGAHGITHRRETFGKPFHNKGHYKVAFDSSLPRIQGFFPGVTIGGPRIGYDVNTGEPLLIDIDTVPVAAPIPEPAGLTLVGMGAMLSAAIARKGVLGRSWLRRFNWR